MRVLLLRQEPTTFARLRRKPIAMNAATSSPGSTIPTTSQIPVGGQNMSTPRQRPTLSNNVCIAIDLEGFFSGRQLGWCDHTGQHQGSIHYKPCVHWPDLSAKDRRMAYYCEKYVHGLPYYPRQSYHVASELLADVRHLTRPPTVL